MSLGHQRAGLPGRGVEEADAQLVDDGVELVHGPLAISTDRHRADQAWLVRAGRPGRGPVDVLVGLDGSAEHARALARARAELERQGAWSSCGCRPASTAPTMAGGLPGWWWWRAIRPRCWRGWLPRAAMTCTVDGQILAAGSYGFVPAGRMHGIEQVGRAGCLLFYLYLPQGATRQAAATPHRRVAALTAEQRAWAAAAELAGR